MKPFRMAVLALTLLPLVALAAPADNAGEADREEKRARMMRVLGLAEELGLDETQALKMAETMRQFDERRRPLMEQVHESARVLRRAAGGDAAVQSQVDQAVQKVFDARAQLATLDRDMYQALSKDLPPQKRAQLAIFMARHEGKMAKFMKTAERQERQERRQERLRERMQRMQQRLQERGAGGQ